MPMKKAFQSSNFQHIDSESDNQTTSIQIRNQPFTYGVRRKPDHKCLQSNLLYATNLPLWFQDEKAIKDEKYFGQYGSIISIMSSVKDTPSSFDDAPQYVQSYITYKDEKDVAIVIAAVNDMMCFSHSVKSTYGTSRLCNNYVNGKRCTLKGCFWLHDQKNVIKLQGPFRADFERQRLLAYQAIKKNLSYFIGRIQTSKRLNDSTEANTDALVHFPSIKETIDKLIQKKVLSKFAYEKAYEEYLSTKKKMSETVKKIYYIRKRTWSSADSQQQNQKSSKSQITKQEPSAVENKTENTVNSNPAPFQPKKKEKSQFLMANILECLDETDDIIPIKKTPAQLQMNKDWQPLPIFTDFYTNKLFEQQELVQTQESEGQKSSLTSKTSKKDSKSLMLTLQIQDHITVQSKSIRSEDSMVVNRVRNQILKTRLVKASMLQFTESMPFRQNQVEFQKVTNILKSQLVNFS